MLTVYVEGIGVYGPGLMDWPSAAAALAGRTPYVPAAFVPPAIDLLPPAERRRISPTIRLALSVARAAVAESGQDPKALATLFASSGGDGDTIHQILESLATLRRDVSPTRFHNSVHNAPSGYWALATQCHAPSTTICAHDWSFGEGFLEAAAQAAAEMRPVGLVAYDLVYPEPLHGVRSLYDAFGVAMILAPASSQWSLARIGVSTAPDGTAETRVEDAALERLRSGNPAARSLPLLAAIARARPDTVIIENAPAMALSLAVTPMDAP